MGPIVVSGSVGSPTFSFAAAAVKAGTNASATASSTMNRLALTQDWPTLT